MPEPRTTSDEIREIVAREMFVAWRSEGGWSGSRVQARDTWYKRTPAATMADWRKRAETLIESLGISNITLTLDPEAAERAGLAGPHPEDICHRCGGPNLVWFAPSPLWNEVMRGGDISAPDRFDGIVCPTCFAVLAGAAGIAEVWRFSAERVLVPLRTDTPSGRTWNEATWLWEDAASGPADQLAVAQLTSTDETEARPAVDHHGEPCTVYLPPECCPDLFRCRVHRGLVPKWLRDRIETAFADLTRERDELRAATAGGEWVTRYYGDAGQADRNMSWSTVQRPAHTYRRRVWIGPVEVAASDGGGG